MPALIITREVIQDRVVLPAYEPPSPVLQDIAPHVKQEAATPAEYFAFRFPQCIKKFGSAILERHQLFNDGTVKIIPVSINEDAFASMLGTEQCQRTIFHQYELQFYRKDKDTGFFNPCAEEDLKLALSQLFLDCAAEMSGSAVDIQPLFETFRSDDVLDRIIRRAKSVLAVNDAFFSSDNNRARNPITCPQESIRSFVDQCLAEDAPAVLTVKDGYDAYAEFCATHQLPRLHLNQFKIAAAPHIKLRFGKGVRNDLDRYGGDRCLGWRGLKVRDCSTAAV